MKHTLDFNSYNSYNSNLSFFNYLLESDNIESESDLKKEEKKELTKWQKIILWVKINKNPILITIGTISVLSIIISIYLKILKHQEESDNEYKELIKDLRDLKIPIKRFDKRDINSTVNDFIEDNNLDINDKKHKDLIKKFKRAIEFKIKTGQDIDNWLLDIKNYENAIKTNVGVNYDSKPPMTWSRSDEEWKIQAEMYDKVNQLEQHCKNLEHEHPGLSNILKDIKFGNVQKSINGIKMSYFGKERKQKIEGFNKMLDFVYDSILNIYKERNSIQKLLN